MKIGEKQKQNKKPNQNTHKKKKKEKRQVMCNAIVHLPLTNVQTESLQAVSHPLWPAQNTPLNRC